MPMKRALLLTIALAMTTLATAQTPQKTLTPTSEGAKVEETDNAIFTVVEQNPEFPGGMEALYQFLAANIKHPGHQDTECSGKVYLTFMVEKDGTVSNAKVLREDCPGYGDEALRVVKLMPKWKPGRQDGKPVRVQYNLPINFSLK